MSKVKTLTKSEEASLQEFAGKCVFENIVFPAMQIGGAGITIQDLIHNRTLDSLSKYNDYLEEHGGRITRADRLTGKTTKCIDKSDITYSEAVSMIDLIIKRKMALTQIENNKARLAEINKEIAALETPAERKTTLKKQKAALEASI